MEKQRDKAAKRLQRKAEKQAGHHEEELGETAPQTTEELEPPETVKTADSTTL